MGLLIRGGDLVTADQHCVSDVYCEGGRITQIADHIAPPEGADVLDAEGLLVLPGFIDPHVHVYLPSTGTFAKDTYETASRAALLGGTTCFIDFVIPAPDEAPLDALATWRAKSDGESFCDYSFHMVVSRFNEQVSAQLREVVAAGIPSFKIHLAYKDVLGLSDDELYETMKLAKDLGVITLGHCENATLIDKLRRQFKEEGKTSPRWHYASRPPVIEAAGTQHFLSFAQLLDAHAYVVHLSCRESLRLAERVVQEGYSVWIESLIQFLLLDKSYADRDDFEAAKYIMSPPLRDKSNHEALWSALASGVISTISTDHAPFDFSGQKEQGRHDFTRIPSGLPGIQDRANLLYTYGVREDRIDLHRFVNAVSTQAAKIFGLYPKKGTIAVGSDADLVLYNPDHESVISAKTHAMNVDYNAFEGWKLKGRAEYVLVRGTPVVERGRFIGRKGFGHFVAREPTH